MDIIEPVEQKEIPDTPTPDTNLLPSESPMFASIQGLFGIQSPSSQEKDMLNTIYEALRTDDNTEASMLWKIKQVESRIGLPPIGVSRLTHLFNYIRMSSHLAKAQAQFNQSYGQ